MRNFENKLCRLNSPRSLKPCYRLGINSNELIKIIFEDYKI